MKDSFKELRYAELVTKREELKKKYFDLRVNMVVHHVDNPLERRNLRRMIARLNTIIHEYALGVREQQLQQSPAQQRAAQQAQAAAEQAQAEPQQVPEQSK